MLNVLTNIIGAKKTVDSVVDTLFDTDKQKLNKEQLIERIKHLPNKEQAQITKLNATHKNILVSGWRPFIGWVCGLNLFYLVCLRDIAILLNLPGFGAGIISKPIGLDMTVELVVVLLGFAGMRTYEKCKGKD